jgi:hypothetical protein
MKPRWRLLLGVFAGLGLYGLALVLCASREPVYDGQPVSFWIEQMTGRSAEAVVADAGGLGPEAVPFLFRRFRRQYSRVRQTYSELRSKLPLPLQRCLPAPSRELNEDALLSAVKFIRPTPVQPLVEVLGDRDPRVRVVAAQALGELRVGADAAVPVLARALSDPDARVRQAAAEALGDLGSAAMPALPALISALQDSDQGPQPGWVVRVRASAAFALAKIGRPAEAAAPALEGLLRDADDRTRLQAAVALWRIRREVRSTLPVLLELLVDRPNWVGAWTVCEVLGEMGPLAIEAVPALTNSLRPADAGNARAFAGGDPHRIWEALQRIDPEAAARLVNARLPE